MDASRAYNPGAPGSQTSGSPAWRAFKPQLHILVTQPSRAVGSRTDRQHLLILSGAVVARYPQRLEADVVPVGVVAGFADHQVGSVTGGRDGTGFDDGWHASCAENGQRSRNDVSVHQLFPFVRPTLSGAIITPNPVPVDSPGSRLNRISSALGPAAAVNQYVIQHNEKTFKLASSSM